MRTNFVTDFIKTDVDRLQDFGYSRDSRRYKKNHRHQSKTHSTCRRAGMANEFGSTCRFLTLFNKFFSDVSIIIFINVIQTINICAQSKVQFCRYVLANNTYGHMKFFPASLKISFVPSLARVLLICHPYRRALIKSEGVYVFQRIKKIFITNLKRIKTFVSS